MAEIKLQGVKKCYANRVNVIHGVDVTIGDGEFVVIVGPSGCGKSTLLRMVAGLETVTEGRIDIGGRTVNEVEPKDRNIAMVFQNYALYPHMSVYDNMAYGLRIRGLAKDEIEGRVQRAAKILELGTLLARRPRELSGGQRQRVAMGRAIVRAPAAFLFDEPLSNLDAKLRVQLRVELQRLHRELRTTSIFVTHDQVEAMTLAERMIVMNAGLVEQVGSPMEVYDAPASLFVAGFIGSPGMNFFPGRRERDAVQLANGIEIPLPSDSREAAPEAVTIGIRPEHLVLGRTGGRPMDFQVDLVEPLGADTLVYGSCAGVPCVARVDGHRSVASGSTLSFTVESNNLHFFDSSTGWRLGRTAAAESAHAAHRAPLQ